ncbi:hypothetical protein BDZ97DRAFT_1346199 [Flammula alnicola]|nr:hypothetical protein BDZ97DRAFT_1346199 [Flammula alnicola]
MSTDNSICVCDRRQTLNRYRLPGPRLGVSFHSFVSLVSSCGYTQVTGMSTSAIAIFQKVIERNIYCIPFIRILVASKECYIPRRGSWREGRQLNSGKVMHPQFARFPRKSELVRDATYITGNHRNYHTRVQENVRSRMIEEVLESMLKI